MQIAAGLRNSCTLGSILEFVSQHRNSLGKVPDWHPGRDKVIREDQGALLFSHTTVAKWFFRMKPVMMWLRLENGRCHVNRLNRNIGNLSLKMVLVNAVFLYDFSVTTMKGTLSRKKSINCSIIQRIVLWWTRLCWVPWIQRTNVITKEAILDTAIGITFRARWTKRAAARTRNSRVNVRTWPLMTDSMTARWPPVFPDYRRENWAPSCDTNCVRPGKIEIFIYFFIRPRSVHWRKTAAVVTKRWVYVIK